MRRYADPVEVRRGHVAASDHASGQGGAEGPQQFLWRGRLWKVRAVLAHWVETSPWWQSTGARAVVGSEEAVAETTQRQRIPVGDLLSERELWRGGARRPRPPARRPPAPP